MIDADVRRIEEKLDSLTSSFEQHRQEQLDGAKQIAAFAEKAKQNEQRLDRINRGIVTFLAASVPGGGALVAWLNGMFR